jgi:glycosyltransferase involved in cell wall biosynthesis
VAQSWICCQLGAREHYAVPRALYSLGLLREFLTDTWVRPGSILYRTGDRRLQGRYHESLSQGQVKSWNLGCLSFEARAKIARPDSWDRILSRNEWFGQKVSRYLSRLIPQGVTSGSGGTFVCSYSYTARSVFEVAREKGWTTVLAQIDPGPVEEQIVLDLHTRYPDYALPPLPAPSRYWESWRHECLLADHIVVNSAWSEECLIRGEVPAKKIRNMPLAYEPPSGAVAFERLYPVRFDKARPMKILFLGQVNLRKGVAPVLEAARSMAGLPVILDLVGPLQIRIPQWARDLPNVRWVGPVPRQEAENHYRSADVFLFPTFSDGFGLTQLEAQAWKLPMIVSKFCGKVVDDGRNGLLLSEVTARTVEDALLKCLKEPDMLARMSQESGFSHEFSLAGLGKSLSSLPVV